MKYQNLALTFLLICSSLLLSLNAQTTIRMVEVGGVYSVPCKINGLELQFIFDTGASAVMISQTEASFMIKNGYLSESDILTTEYYSIADGSILAGAVINIKEIEFGGITYRNIKGSVVPNPIAPLLLGQSILKKLGRYEIDGDNLIIHNGTNYVYDFAESMDDEPEVTYHYNKGILNFEDPQKGYATVFTNSPILEKPGIDESRDNHVVARAESRTVKIITKLSGNYYLVEYEGIKGYIWGGWIYKI